MKEHFQLVLLITLPDRRRDAVARIHEAEFERLMVIEAFRGDVIGVPSWWRAGGGAWGCFSSHIHALHLIWQSGVETALILEDDVIFCDDFPAKLDLLMSKVPGNWGQLYLGGQLRGKTEQINEWVLRASRVNRTHAYAVSRSAIPAMLKHLCEFQQIIKGDAVYHIDHHLEQAHDARLWEVCAPTWWLCGQGGNHSAINGRIEWPRWWHNEVFAEHLPLFVCPSRQPPVEGLHFSYDADGTWCPWVAGKIHDPAKLLGRLREIKSEALRHGYLPGVSHPFVTLSQLASLDPTNSLNAVEWSHSHFLTLTQQPYGFLFPNPWYPQIREGVRQTARPEGEARPGADGPGELDFSDGPVRPPEAAAGAVGEPSPLPAISLGTGGGGASPDGPCGNPGASAAA